jgi:hypothetical protein
MMFALLPWILAAAAGPSLPQAAPDLEAPAATARLESITPDLDGRGGELVTRAIALDGGRSSFVFGGKHCREHRVDAVVLAQLFEALRARQGLHLRGIAKGGVQCLAQVTFFAPEA